MTGNLALSSGIMTRACLDCTAVLWLLSGLAEVLAVLLCVIAAIFPHILPFGKTSSLIVTSLQFCSCDTDFGC